MSTHIRNYVDPSGGSVTRRPTAPSPLATATPSDEWLEAQARKLLEGLPKPRPKPQPKPATPPAPKPPDELDRIVTRLDTLAELLERLKANPTAYNRKYR